jgi:hypothetical protein
MGRALDSACHWGEPAYQGLKESRKRGLLAGIWFHLEYYAYESSQLAQILSPAVAGIRHSAFVIRHLPLAVFGCGAVALGSSVVLWVAFQGKDR